MSKREPRGLRNNNPLNIRKGNSWQGERSPQTDPAFEEFESMEMGLRAGFIIILNYLKRRPPVNTVTAIISRWAPSNENNTQSYIDAVCKYGSLKPFDKIEKSNKNRICRLVWAMCRVECGVLIPFNRIEYAYALACR